MIAWPEYGGKSIGTLLRSSNWSTPTGIIADQTRSGKYTVRLAHVKQPKTFNVVMHMTLDQNRVFEEWWENSCRKGLYPFWHPKVNDNSGQLRQYQFLPDVEIATNNTSANNIEVSMVWMEAL